MIVVEEIVYVELKGDTYVEILNVYGYLTCEEKIDNVYGYLICEAKIDIGKNPALSFEIIEIKVDDEDFLNSEIVDRVEKEKYKFVKEKEFENLESEKQICVEKLNDMKEEKKIVDEEIIISSTILCDDTVELNEANPLAFGVKNVQLKIWNVENVENKREVHWIDDIDFIGIEKNI